MRLRLKLLIMITTLSALLATLLVSTPSHARESAHLCELSAAPPGTLDASEVLTALRRKSESGPLLLARQQDFEKELTSLGGGGACSMSSAFNLIQTLRVALGQETLPVTSTIEAAYRENPDWRSGRLSNLEFVQLLQSMMKLVPNGDRARIWVDETSTAEPPDEAPTRVMWRKWLKFDPKLLLARKGEFKVVVYTIRSPEGRGRTRHFVVLKDGLENGKISVVDSYAPLSPRYYDVTERLVNGTAPALRLEKPNLDDESALYTVDTIFTVAI